MTGSLAPDRDALEQAYRTHDPGLAGHQQGEAVVVDAAGITVLCSANPKGEGEHTWLMRLAHDGNLQWERHYPPGQGAGRALAALPGGGFAIAGDVQRGEMEYQAQLLCTDAHGNITAGAAFGPRGATGLVALAVLTDGSLLAGGTARWKGWLLRGDTTGHASWDLSVDDVDDVHGIVPLDHGGFALVAVQDKSTTALGTTRLAAFSADRRMRWQRRLPAAGRGEATALTILPDGSMAVAGHHCATERDPAQLWVVRMHGKGEIAWERLIGRGDEECRGRAIVSLADQGVVVAGDALRDGQRGLRLARLAADGTVAWLQTYGEDRQYNVARGLARTADDGVVLVGSTTSPGPGKTNVWIVRIDNNGKRLWDLVRGVAG